MNGKALQINFVSKIRQKLPHRVTQKSHYICSGTLSIVKTKTISLCILCFPLSSSLFKVSQRHKAIAHTKSKGQYIQNILSSTKNSCRQRRLKHLSSFLSLYLSLSLKSSASFLFLFLFWIHGHCSMASGGLFYHLYFSLQDYHT